jgi:hypothetical protein
MKKAKLKELMVLQKRAMLRKRNRHIFNEVTAVAAILEADSWEISDPYTEAYTNVGEVHRLDKRHIERICSRERRLHDDRKPYITILEAAGVLDLVMDMGRPDIEEIF